MLPAIHSLAAFNLCGHFSASIVCTVPEPVDFATGPTDGRYNYLDKITYTCNRGYEGISSGNLERSCKDDKTWSGSPPVCGVYLFFNLYLNICYLFFVFH